MSIIKYNGSYYEHTETGQMFRRIVAGLAWPGKKPGHIVIIGEELKPDPTTKTRHLYAVGETEDFDIESLFMKGVEFSNLYNIRTLCGDITDKPMMSLLRQFNNSAREKKLSGLALVAAPQIEEERNFNFYVQTIKRRLHSARKDLHLEETSKLPGYLLEVPLEEVISATALDYPAIAALGYAVAYIDTYQPLPPLPPIDKLNEQKIARSYSMNMDFNRRRR